MKAKILLADDDTDVLAALSGALASEGYEVVVARNGREAIERFREGHIDIALLDLNMPLKGGWEAFERLTTIHPLLQVIIITARPDQYPLAAAAAKHASGTLEGRAGPNMAREAFIAAANAAGLNWRV